LLDIGAECGAMDAEGIVERGLFRANVSHREIPTSTKPAAAGDADQEEA